MEVIKLGSVIPAGASATDASFKYRSHNMIRFYYGVVEEVDENFVIRFRIPGILDNLDKYPPAHPITKNTSQVFKGDHVLIMQLDVANQDYVYFNNDEKPFIGIRYGDLVIDLDTGKIDEPQMDLMVVDLKKEDEDSEIEDQVIEYVDTATSLTHTSIVDGIYHTEWSNDDDKDGKLVVDTDKAIAYTKLMIDKFNDNKDSSTYTYDRVLNESISLNESVSSSENKSTYTIGDVIETITSSDSSKSYKLEVGNSSKITIDEGSTSKIDIVDANNNNVNLSNSGISATDLNNNNIELSNSGISMGSLLNSNLNLGVQVELGNAAGGIKGSLDDLWSELSTVAQNLSTLASLCSSIAVTGPAAIVNGTAGAIPNIVASIASINAKKALVSTVFK